jgi:preprotein translocase subunit SecE
MKQVGLANITQFVRQVNVELRKVEWPSMSDFMGSTMIVFVIVALFAVFFGVFDAIVSPAVQFILQINRSL